MAKTISLLLFLFGISSAAFIGIGNQVFEVGVNPIQRVAVSFGYGLDYVPDDASLQPDDPTFVNHFLARVHHRAYIQDRFSASWGFSILYVLGVQGASHEDIEGAVSLFVEPEYMLADRIGLFATCNVPSFRMYSPGRSGNDGTIDLSPDFNVGFRFKFGNYK